MYDSKTTKTATTSRTNRRQHNNKAATVATAVLLGAAAITNGGAARAQTLYRYDITKIEKPAAADSILPTALSEMGKVTGTVRLTEGGSFAFLWRPTTPNGTASAEGLLNLTGAGAAEGNGVVDKAGVNDPVNSGTVIGWRINASDQQRSFLWTGGTIFSPPEAPGGHIVRGVAINAPRSHCAQAFEQNATGLFRTLGQPWQTLGVSRPGDTTCYVSGMNDLNQVVGDSGSGGNVTRAFLWSLNGTDGDPSNPKMRDLGVPAGFARSTATGVNNREQVVGTVTKDQFFSRGFLWTRQNGMKVLPDTVPGLSQTIVNFAATDINNHGQVSGGLSLTGGGGGGFLYSSQTGPVLLSTLVNPASLPALALDSGVAINDRGQILASTLFYTGGETPYNDAYLLTPRWQYGVVDAATDGAFNRTTLLWRNDTTQQFAVWRIGVDGAIEIGKLFDAVEGYQPIAVATAANERTRVLLVSPEGRAVVWTLSPNLQGIVSAATLPLAAGYTPVHIAIGGTDERTRVGLYNASTRSYALWHVSDAGVVNAAGVYKNIKDYTPVSLTVGSDNKPRLLLKSDTQTGKAALWTFTVTGQVLVSGKILAVGGASRGDWDAVDVASSLGDLPLTVMWKNRVNFQTAVWTVNGQTGAVVSGKTFGAVAHATTKGVSLGSDGKPRLLWQYDDGRSALWRLSPTCALEAGYAYKADK